MPFKMTSDSKHRTKNKQPKLQKHEKPKKHRKTNT